MTRPSRHMRIVTSPEEELLTIRQVLAELDVPRATFYRWRQRGRAPKSFKLPNGQVRIRRSALDAWLDNLEESA